MKGRPNGNKAGPAPGGVTALSAFPAQGEEAVLTAQPIEKIMAAVEVSVVALEHVCCCSGAIRVGSTT
jgi:hypothetical protein